MSLITSSQEAVGDTLQELWISYNNIEKLKGITVLAKLKVYIANIILIMCNVRKGSHHFKLPL